jgi:hypothetical protein
MMTIRIFNKFNNKCSKCNFFNKNNAFICVGQNSNDILNG